MCINVHRNTKNITTRVGICLKHGTLDTYWVPPHTKMVGVWPKIGGRWDFEVVRVKDIKLITSLYMYVKCSYMLCVMCVCTCTIIMLFLFYVPFLHRGAFLVRFSRDKPISRIHCTKCRPLHYLNYLNKLTPFARLPHSSVRN